MNSSAVHSIVKAHFRVNHVLAGIDGSGAPATYRDTSEYWLAPDLIRVNTVYSGHTVTILQTQTGARLVSRTSPSQGRSTGSARPATANAMLATGMHELTVSNFKHDFLLGYGERGRTLAEIHTDQKQRPSLRYDSDELAWVTFSPAAATPVEYKIRLNRTYNWLADRREAARTDRSGQVTHDIAEISAFHELAPGLWFPRAMTIRILVGDVVRATHTYEVELLSNDFPVTSELLTLQLPPGIWVRDLNRKVFIKTDAVGNLTKQEQPDTPTERVVDDTTAAGPTPLDADDRANRLWMWLVAGAALLGVGGVGYRLTRRES